jgi:hypothetical protein
VSDLRNAPPSVRSTPNLSTPLRRWMGFMLLGGTMSLAGMLALWRALAWIFGK